MVLDSGAGQEMLNCFQVPCHHSASSAYAQLCSSITRTQCSYSSRYAQDFQFLCWLLNVTWCFLNIVFTSCDLKFCMAHYVTMVVLPVFIHSFIHSFIMSISVASLQGDYSGVVPIPVWPKSKVFR